MDRTKISESAPTEIGGSSSSSPTELANEEAILNGTNSSNYFWQPLHTMTIERLKVSNFGQIQNKCSLTIARLGYILGSLVNGAVGSGEYINTLPNQLTESEMLKNSAVARKKFVELHRLILDEALYLIDEYKTALLPVNPDDRYKKLYELLEKGGNPLNIISDYLAEITWFAMSQKDQTRVTSHKEQSKYTFEEIANNPQQVIVRLEALEYELDKKWKDIGKIIRAFINNGIPNTGNVCSDSILELMYTRVFKQKLIDNPTGEGDPFQTNPAEDSFEPIFGVISVMLRVLEIKINESNNN